MADRAPLLLKEPLDDLGGDPGAINVVAATWGEVATACARAGDRYARIATSQTATWKGESGDAYRAAAAQVAEQIKAMEGAANSVATGIRASGVLVASVRGIIRDLIADVVAEIVIAAATALATSWCSFGASIAAFTGWAVARGASTAGKIAGKISKLLMKLSQAIRKFDNLRGASNALAKASVAIGRKANATGRAIGRNGAAVRQIESGITRANNAVRDRITFGSDTLDNAAPTGRRLPGSAGPRRLRRHDQARPARPHRRRREGQGARELGRELRVGSAGGARAALTRRRRWPATASSPSP